MNLKEIPKGKYFTIKSIEYPRENQVFIKGDYDRSTKTYNCVRFSDINDSRNFKGNKVVYTDEFIF